MFIIVTLFCCAGRAQLDLTAFKLTLKQIAIIRDLEAKGHLSDEVLLKLAYASQKHNEKKEVYVPEHTNEQLELVQKWAVGGVFQRYANQVGVHFDDETYLKSYPIYKNGQPFMAIFNFGFITGAEYFEIDIIIAAISVESVLSHSSYTMSASDFKDYYLSLAETYDMKKFLLHSLY
jgi:predicted ATPase with chaperone activity